MRWISFVASLALAITSHNAQAAGPIKGYAAPRTLAMAYALACGVRPDHSTVCWGRPGDPPPSFPLNQIVSGNTFMCGLTVSSAAACWGKSGPEIRPPSGAFLRVAAGSFVGCGVRPDATLACWGQSTLPVFNPPAGLYDDVAVNDYNACAIAKTTGALVCWGNRFSGDQPPTGGSYAQIVLRQTRGTSPGYGCAVRTDGAIVCWGDDGGSGREHPPAGVFSTIALGENFGCALDSRGVVVCWGRDNAGQRSGAPAGPQLQIAAASETACSQRPDQTVVCWGGNHAGEKNPPPGPFLPPPALRSAPHGATHPARPKAPVGH